MNRYCTGCGVLTDAQSHCDGFPMVTGNELINEDANGYGLCCPVQGCQWRRPMPSQAPQELSNARSHFVLHQAWHADHPERLPKRKREPVVQMEGTDGQLFAAARQAIMSLFRLLPLQEQNVVVDEIEEIRNE